MKRFDQINVIPFIDIMLVLLAIVLMTATFIAQGKLSIDVPDAESSETLTDEQQYEIAVDANGDYFFDEVTLTLSELSEKLIDLKRDAPIVLRVDKAATFEKFIAVVDLLKKNQLERLSIITRQPG